MDIIKVFCPATIANISCGFDILGLALNEVGDEMTVKKVAEPGIRITSIIGQDLPLEATKNVAGVAGLALLQDVDCDFGFDIAIDKRIKAGSGIGSSAASAAGAVWAINELLGRPLSVDQLVPYAMAGEKLASGVPHADNVAPVLFGGFTLVRSYDPLDVIRIHTPKELYATIIHPQIEVKTADSRRILKTKISLGDGVKQWGNVGGLIAGLYTEDYDLIGRSLVDHIVEPIRSMLIPGFEAIKKASMEVGALGCGISGSGPSVFAFSKGLETANSVKQAMEAVYDPLELPYETHVSGVNLDGVRAVGGVQ
ncbi:homoserine kinase [Poritiphilus flavus]|uniref:Homoserine kinase n=1 Tax=Poritiphilus flavus TaxID=2697053 RepID=A0A6L9EBI8_9FLAO|nr:homoserine kinase [Poritiphilus flavus]NAS12115.1 homoserine kinase [Poritiphilus flavus]